MPPPRSTRSRIVTLLSAAVLLACGGEAAGPALDPDVAPPGALAYAANPARYVLGAAIPSNAPALAGGAPDGFTVSPALPPGLSLDPATGAIAGTPLALAPAARYRVTARNAGGSASASLSLAVGAPPTDLRLSEIGNAYYYDVPAWLELHNPTPAAIDLGRYALRARGIDPTNGALSGATLFALPHVELAPGAFLVVGGQVRASAPDGPGIVRVRDAAGRVPFWFGSGWVEVVRDGATVDFVRFGDSERAPTTAGAWGGANAPGFPTSGPGGYGRSLARDLAGTDTGTAADWSEIPFATPGGPNDVPPGAADDDGDGIPDASESPGGTFAGLDLHAMGARPGQPDLLVELDWMDSDDPGVVPRREAIDAVVAICAAHGLAVHFDAGDLFSGGLDPAAHALGQGPSRVPAATCVTVDGFTPGCATDLHGYKARHMELRRQGVFHYALFGTSQNVDGSAGSSGRAEISGNDLLVTLGGWGLDPRPGDALHTLVNFQTGTLLHELGHNLGLRHGGFEDVNGKPNYLSVMNYQYQLYGLPDAGEAFTGDRYLLDRLGLGDECGLVAGPCDEPAEVVFDFSSGASGALDERALYETAGLRRPGYGGVDFDGDGSVSATATKLDLNGDGLFTVLRDSDDWGRVALPFQRAPNGQPGTSPASLSVVPRAALSPVDDDRQPLGEEAPPPAALLEAVRRRRDGVQGARAPVFRGGSGAPSPP